MKKLKASIVIGTLNQCEVLKKVLPFYEELNTSKEEFEVIVVDSTSNDGSIEFLESFKPKFNFKYHIQKNDGKASARNKAASMATGHLLIITDADMIPGKDFVQGHLDAHRSTDKECCFEGLAWNLKTLEFPPKTETLTPQVGTHPKHMSSLGWYYFLTGNVSVPKTLFDEEKGFNELFKGYGWEDLELGYRLSRKKIPLYYLKTSVNYHYHIINNDDFIKRNVLKGESAKLFLKLHPELKWFLGFNPISTFIFPRIKEGSWLFNFFSNYCYKHSLTFLDSIGFWFLQEYYYQKGALNS